LLVGTTLRCNNSIIYVYNIKHKDIDIKERVFIMNTAKARVLELLDAGAYGILKSDDVSLKTSNILELDRLVPEDWMYRAEGNANMCFSYIGPDTRLVSYT
jgi:hypothetical protein